jgi:diacylglycerol kinase (ATP)
MGHEMTCETSPSRSSSICVIFNPAAGRSRARQRLDTISTGWLSNTELWPTERPGHAEELARCAAASGFGIVAAAGGDGTVHEVANGVLQADRPNVCFAVIPLGSADDYAHSLLYPHDGPRLDPARERLVDVGRVRINDGVERYFVCGLGLGLSACVTVEAQQIRRLQGQLLYGLAALKAMWRRWSYLELTGTIDDEPITVNPTLLISLLLGRREGGFVLAPDARLDDGWFDCVQAGNLTRWEALRLIPSVSATGPPRNHPKLHLRRCRQMIVESAQDLVIHTDGEILCRPEDRVRRVEIELLPGRLRVRHGLPPA